MEFVEVCPKMRVCRQTVSVAAHIAKAERREDRECSLEKERGTEPKLLLDPNRF